MNRREALATLGLTDPVTMDEIKAAYLESVQILHPDKFAGNHKLQERATEQFKHMQEAYEYLRKHSKGASAPSADDLNGAAYDSEDDYATQNVRARLAGLQAAREQIVAQRDAQIDRRQNAIYIAGIGAVVFFLLHRIPFMVALGGTAMIWGIIDIVSARKNIESLDSHIRALEAQKRKLEERL